MMDVLVVLCGLPDVFAYHYGTTVFISLALFVKQPCLKVRAERQAQSIIDQQTYNEIVVVLSTESHGKFWAILVLGLRYGHPFS